MIGRIENTIFCHSLICATSPPGLCVRPVPLSFSGCYKLAETLQVVCRLFDLIDLY